MKSALIRPMARALAVLAIAIIVVGVLAQTTLYPRLRWYFEDSVQGFLGPSLAMNHVLAVDVDEDSIRRLEPELGAWPYSRDVYARAARFLIDHGARAIVFDVLFAEPRRGDDALASTLDRRSVLAAAALSQAMNRPPEYVERIKGSAVFEAASRAPMAVQSA